jgi:hypothetical protein
MKVAVVTKYVCNKDHIAKHLLKFENVICKIKNVMKSCLLKCDFLAGSIAQVYSICLV